MMNCILIYYSYTENTGKLAKKISSKLGCDIAEIKTSVSYPDDYNETVQQGQDEVESGYMPEINPLKCDFSKYDTIILGTPVWWYTFAPAVKTFLANTNLFGKKIYPFITNGGWIGHTIKDIAIACPNSQVFKAINVKFDGTNMKASQAEIDKWISEIV